MRLGIVSAGVLCLTFAAVGQPAVQQWHPTDLTFTSATSHGNPFQDVALTATFTGPGGTTLTIPGFHNGGATWIIRFAPTKVGSWTYTTTSNDINLNGQTGSVTCIANTSDKVHGKLWIDQTNQHHFVYEDGARYFLMGGEIDWLGLMDFSDANIVKEKQIIDMYADNGFTQVMMDIFASDPTWSESGHGAGTAYDFGPPDAWPFAGTNSSPDHSRMNPAFFNHYDKVIDYLFQKGIVAHLYFKVYTKQVNYPSNYSANDSLFWRYITARYQAYENIVWDFAKESHTMTNNNNAYKRDMLALVKSKDAYRRLVTTHDDDNFYGDATSAATVDFRTDQQHDTWYNTIINQRNSRNWPVYNAEYGYEWGPGGSGDYTYYVVQDPETVVKRTYEIVMAGGYPCYYYTYHAWDIVKYDQTPAGLHYYKDLSDFFTRTRWYQLLPTDNLLSNTSGNHCLSKAGTEYIVYLSNGGTTNLTVAGVSGQLAATWMNAYTGAEQTGTGPTNGSYAATSPWPNTPSLLWLRISGTGTPAAHSVAVSPGTALVAPGGSQTFTATVYDQYGAVFSAAVDWTSTIGSVSSSGQFTAPSTAGNGYVIATVNGTAIKDSSAVTVGTGQSGTFFIDASSGTLANGMSASTGSGSIALQVVSGTTGTITAPLSTDSKATYSITVTGATWYAWARLYGSDDNHNSFWIQIDNGAPQRLGNSQTFNTWVWERNQGVAIDLGTLADGPHTLTVHCREPEALLDRICLTPDANFVPTDNLVGIGRGRARRLSVPTGRTPVGLYDVTGKCIAQYPAWDGRRSGLPRGVYVKVSAVSPKRAVFLER